MASGVQPSERFGALLRRYRQARLLSQEVLAERARLSVGAISALERGVRTLPRPDTVALLARALSLSAEERTAFAAAARPQPAVIPASRSPASAGAPPLEPPGARLRPAPLPVALTGFIGRAQDLVALRQRLLEPRTRLLTLTGPGGTGKTRLAVEVAHLVEPAFADGVVFVALAPLSDPDLVLPAIMQTLGLRETAGGTPLETLQAALEETQLLLVLDNCEQVVAAAPDIGALLVTAPELRVLATSRTRLALAGERVYPVNPLHVPGPAEVTDPATLEQSDAVQLFVARAQDALPSFSLNADTALPVAAICARLDGLPLAIELAAARSRLLVPAALLKRLDNSLVLLTGGPRDLPQRHQALRETIAWSYVLLDAQGQALFRRLGVFAGGCTVEAAEAVCRVPDGLPRLEGDLLLALSALADQSLVVTAADVDGEPRFTLLETIRTYALEQLTATAELNLVRDRHLAWCVQLAEAAGPELQGPHAEQWLHRLEIEHDNLRSALEWSFGGEGAFLQGLRLATALGEYWRRRGRLSEGRSTLERAVAQADRAGVPAALRVRACLAAGHLATRQGDYAPARELYQQSLRLGREMDDKESIAESLSGLGVLAQRWGDYAQARTLYEEGLAFSRALNDRWGIAVSLNNLGTVADEQGNYELARVLYEESLALARELGNTMGIATLLNNLGNMAQQQGDYEQAWALDEESLILRRRIDDKPGLALSLNNLGRVATCLGNYEQAKVLLEEGLALCRALGDKQGIAYLHISLGDLAIDQGDYAQAGVWYGEGLAVFRALGEQHGTATVLRGLGRVAYYRGDCERAKALYTESLLLHRDLGGKLGAIETLEGLALVAAAEGDSRRAALLWGATAAGRAIIKSPLSPRERAEREQAIAALPAVMGEAAYADAWAGGQVMSLEEVMASVL